MSKDNSISRKAFLGKISMLGLAGAGAGVILKGCGNGEEATEALTPAMISPVLVKVTSSFAKPCNT
jgi:hypothetical protein